MQARAQGCGVRLSSRLTVSDTTEAEKGLGKEDRAAIEADLERMRALEKEIGAMRKVRKQRPTGGKTDDCLLIAMRPAETPAPDHA